MAEPGTDVTELWFALLAERFNDNQIDAIDVEGTGLADQICALIEPRYLHTFSTDTAYAMVMLALATCVVRVTKFFGDDENFFLAALRSELVEWMRNSKPNVCQSPDRESDDGD